MLKPIVILALLMLTGCGGMSPTVERTTFYPDGRIVREKMSLPAGHFLANPTIKSASFGDLKFEGFASQTDNEGIAAVFSGIVSGIGKLIGVKP